MWIVDPFENRIHSTMLSANQQTQKSIKVGGLRRLGRLGKGHHCCEASPDNVENEEYFLDPAVGRYDVGHLRIFHQLQAVTLAAKI